jgi:hypothetical protein
MPGTNIIDAQPLRSSTWRRGEPLPPALAPEQLAKGAAESSSSTIGINPESNTSSLDSSFLQTVVLNNREFQQYSITNQVYFVPIDEVRDDAAPESSPRSSSDW